MDEFTTEKRAEEESIPVPPRGGRPALINHVKVKKMEISIQFKSFGSMEKCVQINYDKIYKFFQTNKINNHNLSQQWLLMETEPN